MVLWSFKGLLTTQFAPRHSPELGVKRLKHDSSIRQTTWFCEEKTCACALHTGRRVYALFADPV